LHKSTYGTGAFLVQNTGTTLKLSRHRLLSTVAYRLAGQPVFALEGSIFVAGAAVKWLRDELRLIGTAGETESLARSVADTGGVHFVPAFAGLGAPWWDPDARGALLGLTRSSGVAQIARAAVEAVACQTRDLLEAMTQDGVAPAELRVDGGMVVNNWLVQHVADMLRVPVVRPAVVETTALGAAFLAGLQAGVHGSLDDIAALWCAERRFEPRMPADRADALHAAWRGAVARLRTVN
jgi:glycerol kinase